ncbi:MAG: DNA primase [Nitrospinae bacterium]|nr:DNA primase [Nitrospinota bacterium]MBI5748883.1 DNA primase [Nitrospinota bacterium]
MGGYIPDELVEEIRARSDIVEVISDRVLLKKSGVNYKGLCPFHSEKTPSFTVSPAKQIFHCFGCNEGGNVYQFVMKIENLSFPDSVLLLARRYGINIAEQKVKGVNSSQKNTLYEVNAMAAEFFLRQLSELPQGKTAREYLRKRGINEDIIESFKIGYASTSWDGIHQFLKKKGISADIQNSAGLVKERENGGGYVDRFRERVIFTISDSEGRIVGFGGRVLNDTDSRPKYLNSPETLVYKKGNILYGLHITKDSIRKSKEAFLVEGYFDLITAYQHGVKNIIATSGTALTEDHARLLRRYTETVTLVFDGDEAGRNASNRGGMVLLNGGVKVKVIPLPQGNDPDSFIREKSGEGFLNIARESKTFMEYIINKEAAGSDLKSIDGRVKCINAVIPFLSLMNNSVEKSMYISSLAEKTGVSEKAIMDEMNKNKVKDKAKDKAKVKEALTSTFNKAERILVQLMLLDNKNIDKIKKNISVDNFKDDDMAKISSVLFTLSDSNDNISISHIMDMLSEERLKKLVSEMVFEDIEYQEVDKNISDCIRYIKKNRIDVNELVNQLKTAVSEGNHKRFKDLQGQILKIKQNAVIHDA